MERWGQRLAPGTDVLDLGCGAGVPITETLLNVGLNVWAMDASPTLVAEFRTRFPKTTVLCERVQESDFFERKFGAIVSVGLMFLLDVDDQIALVRTVSTRLVPGGRFLFSAPVESGTWNDLTTGLQSRSLGLERYTTVLRESGFSLERRYLDEGNNNYYDAVLHTPA